MVGRAEGGDQAAHLVRVAVGKGRVRGQAADPLQGAGQGAAGLQGEPFVHHQRVVLPALVEVGEQLCPGVQVRVDHRGERSHGVGHVARPAVLVEPQGEQVRIVPAARVRGEQVGQAEVPERAPAGVHRVVAIGRAHAQFGVAFPQFRPQFPAHSGAEPLAHGEHGHRVDHGQLLADPVLRGQHQGHGQECRVAVAVAQQVAQALVERPGQGDRVVLPGLVHAGEQVAQGELLACLPAVEGVRVTGHAQAEFLVGLLESDPHRRGEVTQEGDHRPGRYRREHERLLPLLEHEHPGAVLVRALDGQGCAIPVEQAHGKRHEEGFLDRGLAGRRAGLHHMQGELFAGLVPVGLHGQLRRAGLGVPALEPGQIQARGRFHGADKVLAGYGLAVVAGEVQVHAPAEPGLAEQGVEHADHLRALVVHGQGVEVVDLHERGRPHRVGHGARVLAELERADDVHVLDAFHRPADQVRGEFLVAEHGQPLLEAQLEPVAAGDAVAGPVVEVLVRDHRLDALVIGVRGRLRQGEHVLGVEHVQPLVLHGAHVEVVHGHDHVGVQVILAAEPFLVPAHGLFQGAHGVVALVPVARLDIDAQVDGAAGAGGEGVGETHQVAGHQREQVGGLGKGVVPGGPVAAVRQVAAVNAVAVGEQHRAGGPVADHGGGEHAHHVRPVREAGDGAEPLGLALGAVVARGAVEPLQGGVALRVDAGVDGHLERGGGRVGDDQLAVGKGVSVRAEVHAVDGHPQQLQTFAVEHQRRAGGGVGPAVQPRLHERGTGVQFDPQVDAVHQVGGRGVVLEKGLFFLGSHDGLSCAVGSQGKPGCIRQFRNAPGNGILCRFAGRRPRGRAGQGGRGATRKVRVLRGKASVWG